MEIDISATPDQVLADGAVVTAAAAVAVVASLWAAAVLAVRLRRGERAIPSRPHPAACWGGGDVAAVLLGYLTLVTALAGFIPVETALAPRLVSNAVTTLLAAGLGIAILRSRGADFEMLGLRSASVLADLRLALFWLALVVAPILALAGVLDRIEPYRHPVVDFLAANRDPGSLALVLLAAVVVAPCAEEFFFRRVLQGWLEKRMPESQGGGAIVVSAAAFALAHWGQGLAYVPLFPFGLVLGAIALKTGSIVPCILLHAMFNAVSIAVVLLTVPPA